MGALVRLLVDRGYTLQYNGATQDLTVNTVGGEQITVRRLIGGYLVIYGTTFTAHVGVGNAVDRICDLRANH